jgi:hypothetical protein
MSVKELKNFELSSMIKKECQPKLRTTRESPEWFYDRPQSDRAVPSELDRPQSDRAKFRRVDRPQSDRANPIQRHPEPPQQHFTQTRRLLQSWFGERT